MWLFDSVSRSVSESSESVSKSCMKKKTAATTTTCDAPPPMPPGTEEVIGSDGRIDQQAMAGRLAAARRQATAPAPDVAPSVSASESDVGDDEEDMCPVCRETMVSPVGLYPCGHNLCATCLMRWHGAQPQLTCPLDRTPTEAICPSVHYHRKLRERYNQTVDRDIERRNDLELLAYYHNNNANNQDDDDSGDE
eukprot:TRINITY_DN14850_c0_g2_i2.p1 TRINITY_DN14850_c0_g2~~TRINITY_DN14850_c0_g2_i2.p1  ORF type:complete len:194 (-),score=26.34 TRINITY_DN14850_c0_g2_i2:149-730(-)